MAKILLADDDHFYRGALRNSLKLSGHEVQEAEDGKEAMSILESQEFDLVISDIRMPGVTGVELLQWIKARKQTPVILITGFSELLESHKAAELGAADFLLKPFKSADIESSIARVLKGAQAGPAQAADLDGNYCKIPLEDFISGSRICFDIFLRVSSSRYLKIAHGGEDIAVDRIRNFKNKGLRNLYLTREDFAKYVGFNLAIAKRLKDADHIPDKKKLNFLRYSSEVVLEQLFLEGADAEEFTNAKEFVQTTLGIVQDNDEAFELLEALNKHADFIYAQSLGVSIYSVMAAKAMDWTSTPTLFKVSLAGLFHDLGLKEIDKAILAKSRNSLSAEERQIYETHPIRAMELLNRVKGIPADAILVAYQHHENWVGFGYPQKLSRNKTHPVARLIHVVDTFCDFVIEGAGTFSMTPKEALRQMTQYYESSLDPVAFVALKKIFQSAEKPT